MKKALIIIDYINDFVESDGKLTCGEPAQKLDKIIASLVNEFANNGDFVVVASDKHEENDIYHPEGNMFPPHCISGTRGAQSYGETLVEVQKVPKDKLVNIDKTRYSAFAGTSLDLKMRERGVTDVYLVGVCTDICVLHTAVDCYNLGYTINVYKNAVASFNEEGHNFALIHFKNTLGAKII